MPSDRLLLRNAKPEPTVSLALCRADGDGRAPGRPHTNAAVTRSTSKPLPTSPRTNTGILYSLPGMSARSSSSSSAASSGRCRGPRKFHTRGAHSLPASRIAVRNRPILGNPFAADRRPTLLPNTALRGRIEPTTRRVPPAFRMQHASFPTPSHASSGRNSARGPVGRCVHFARCRERSVTDHGATPRAVPMKAFEIPRQRPHQKFDSGSQTRQRTTMQPC